MTPGTQQEVAVVSPISVVPATHRGTLYSTLQTTFHPRIRTKSETRTANVAKLNDPPRASKRQKRQKAVPHSSVALVVMLCPPQRGSVLDVTTV